MHPFKLQRTWLLLPSSPQHITNRATIRTTISVLLRQTHRSVFPEIGFTMDCGLRHTRLPFPDHYNRCQPGGYRVSRLIPPLNATVTDSIRDVNVPRDVAKNTYAISVRDRIFFPNIIFVAQPKHPVFSTNLPSPSPPNLPSPVKVERLRILLYG